MEDGTLFDHQSEHTSIQIRAAGLTIRVNHGNIHKLAMRDPTDQYDLPDHIAYQMNLGFELLNIGSDPEVKKPALHCVVMLCTALVSPPSRVVKMTAYRTVYRPLWCYICGVLVVAAPPAKRTIKI